MYFLLRMIIPQIFKGASLCSSRSHCKWYLLRISCSMNICHSFWPISNFWTHFLFGEFPTCDFHFLSIETESTLLSATLKLSQACDLITLVKHAHKTSFAQDFANAAFFQLYLPFFYSSRNYLEQGMSYLFMLPKLPCDMSGSSD